MALFPVALSTPNRKHTAPMLISEHRVVLFSTSVGHCGRCERVCHFGAQAATTHRSRRVRYDWAPNTQQSFCTPVHRHHHCQQYVVVCTSLWQQLPPPSILRNVRNNLRIRLQLTCAASGGGVGLVQAKTEEQGWRLIAGICAVAMFLCNLHRSVFTMTVPAIAQQLQLSASQVGVIQSAMLLGYLLGQLPAGRLSDMLGGDRVLVYGLLLWSLSTAATGLASHSPYHAMCIILASRMAMGLFSACAMPAVSAMASTWVPAAFKASTIGIIYALFNVGGVVGLAVTPVLISFLGWPGTLNIAGGVGVAWSLLALAMAHYAGQPQGTHLARSLEHIGTATSSPGSEIVTKRLHHSSSTHANQDRMRHNDAVQLRKPNLIPHDIHCQPGSTMGDQLFDQQQQANQIVSLQTNSMQQPTEVITVGIATDSSGSAQRLQEEMQRLAISGQHINAQGQAIEGNGSISHDNRKLQNLVQVAGLCWAHGVIGWGFFILQSWIPQYIQLLGASSLQEAGALAGLPWLAAAASSSIAGRLADTLISQKHDRLHVRRLMHAVSTLGCAACVLPLVMLPVLPAAVATACLIATLACYGFSFGGFHAYVQDVAASDAGLMLGVTNSCSIVMGILGNLVTGYVVEMTGSYQLVYLLTAVLYLSSCVVFHAVLKGKPVSLAAVCTC